MSNLASHRIHEFYEYWHCNMMFHPDVSFVNTILNYVKYGIPVGYTCEMFQIYSANWPSAHENSVNVYKFIQEQL